jgi:hypothetical protein
MVSWLQPAVFCHSFRHLVCLAVVPNDFPCASCFYSFPEIFLIYFLKLLLPRPPHLHFSAAVPCRQMFRHLSFCLLLFCIHKILHIQKFSSFFHRRIRFWIYWWHNWRDIKLILLTWYQSACYLLLKVPLRKSSAQRTLSDWRTEEYKADHCHRAGPFARSASFFSGQKVL